MKQQTQNSQSFSCNENSQVNQSKIVNKTYLSQSKENLNENLSQSQYKDELFDTILQSQSQSSQEYQYPVKHKKIKQTKAQKNLIFPVNSIGVRLRNKTNLGVEKETSRWMALIMEVIVAEILEAAGDEIHGKKNIIQVKSIRKGIEKDPQLLAFYKRFLKKNDGVQKK